MIIIFHKRQPLGKLLIERNTKGVIDKISIKRNNIQLYESDDYSLREIEKKKETTIVQDFDGSEIEVITIVEPPR
jgi:hypothetical protein